MDVVGTDRGEWTDDHVHTIDIWFSRRRGCWMVERLNASGHLVGSSHRCATRDDAEQCLAEWLRTHGETHLATPGDPSDPDERASRGTAGRPAPARLAA